MGRPGVIVTDLGLIRNARCIEVRPLTIKPDGAAALAAPVPAKVIYRSPGTGLAVLELLGPPGAPVPLEVAAKDPTPGQKVFARHPPGAGAGAAASGPGLIQGMIRADPVKLGERILLEHSAAVPPDGSGGPLLDGRGRVVGVVTSRAGGKQNDVAVPVSQLRGLFPAN